MNMIMQTLPAKGCYFEFHQFKNFFCQSLNPQSAQKHGGIYMNGTWIGLLGMLLLVSAWVPQTIETIRTKKCPLNFRFVLIYVMAASLLTVYSYLIRDWIFLTLNGLSAFQSGINLLIKIRHE